MCTSSPWLSLALGLALGCGGASRSSISDAAVDGADMAATDAGPADSGSNAIAPDDSALPPGSGNPLPDGAADCVGDPVSLLGLSLDRWQYGDIGTAFMHPGSDCIGCHAGGGGPRFTTAGSVMDAWHEPDDCFGTQGVTVELIGADGVVTSLTTNETGNFYSSDSIAVPYTARLVGADGAVREMFTPQTDLDCMNCHTQDGTNGAPGRIGRP